MKEAEYLSAVLEQRPKAPEGVAMQISGDSAPGEGKSAKACVVKRSGCKQQEVFEAGM